VKFSYFQVFSCGESCGANAAARRVIACTARRGPFCYGASMRAGPAWLAIVLLAAGVGCNTRAHQCDQLIGVVAPAWHGAEQPTAITDMEAVDQAIRSIAHTRAYVTALDLPDRQLDGVRRQFVGVLDRSLAKLRAFAAVSGDREAAAAEEPLTTVMELRRDESPVVADLHRQCPGSRWPRFK
jgi:hypothetical protein